MATTKTPVSSCPSCGKIVNAISRLVDDDKHPKPDDFTVCIGCGAVLVINYDLTVRSPRPGELDTMDTENRADVQKIQEALRILHAREEARRCNPRVRSRSRRKGR